MVSLVAAEKQDEEKLRSLVQKYLCEMSRYYETPMDADGSYAYPYLPYYFLEPDRRAYFIYADGELAGFAMVNTHSFVEPAADRCLAEFTVFPAFRRRGYAREAMLELFRLLPGVWQLKFSEANVPGASFWRKLTAPYAAAEHTLDGGETAVVFNTEKVI